MPWIWLVGLDLRAQIQICCLDMLKRDGFGFGPNPSRIWPKSIQDLRHRNPLISNSLTPDGICQILQLVSTFFFKRMLPFMFFFKLKLKSLLILVLRFVSLNSPRLLKHLCLSLLSIVNLNRKILIESSKFICALVSFVWFVYDLSIGFVWFFFFGIVVVQSREKEAKSFI